MVVEIEITDVVVADVDVVLDAVEVDVAVEVGVNVGIVDELEVIEDTIRLQVVPLKL